MSLIKEANDIILLIEKNIILLYEMKKLKIAVLWHQHQPYYRKGDEFILPWVRFHGIKDYYDLAEILNEFPKIKQTFNIVPSMLLQINEYLSGECSDKIQRLTKIPASQLNDNEKREILASFFLCNSDNMINPYRRYRELFDMAQNPERAIENFNERDWLDLQVWYNLCWFGPYSRQQTAINRFFSKGENFTEEEKLIILELCDDILSRIIPTLSELKRLKQIEISCSPMYHPILPLLCSSDRMLEALPHAALPKENFSYPQDAEEQITAGLRYFEKCFSFIPDGIWPSEGSLSDEVISMIASKGVKWIATDEMILANTLQEKYTSTDKYFPAKFNSPAGEIAIYFRDHSLSDAIGFTYSNWHHTDAVNDYLSRLNNIRNELCSKFGEDILDSAVVPVILDGENCWEFYRDNGIHFLKELYSRLSDSDIFETVTMSEGLKAGNSANSPKINHLRAGSWINANFNIWMGHPEHIAAWEMLLDARKLAEKKLGDLLPGDQKKLMNEIYIAEGSDWFWWYGDSHFAPNKYDFDDLFRYHIAEIYRISDSSIPENVFIPINEAKKEKMVIYPSKDLAPTISGSLDSSVEWAEAGKIFLSKTMSAMHQIGEFLKEMYYCKKERTYSIRFVPIEKYSDFFGIEFVFPNLKESKLIISKNQLKFINNTELTFKKIDFICRDFIDLAIELEKSTDELISGKDFSFHLNTTNNNEKLRYPRQGNYNLI